MVFFLCNLYFTMTYITNTPLTVDIKHTRVSKAAYVILNDVVWVKCENIVVFEFVNVEVNAVADK